MLIFLFLENWTALEEKPHIQTVKEKADMEMEASRRSADVELRRAKERKRQIEIQMSVTEEEIKHFCLKFLANIDEHIICIYFYIRKFRS